MPADNTEMAPDVFSAPQTTEDFVRTGWIQRVKGDHKAAEADFRKALSKSPRSVEATYGLGMALKIQGRAEEAVEAFKKTQELIESGELKSDPARATILKNLSESHILLIQSGLDLEGKAKS
jgi:Flp pilus assembly protein TadD